MEPSTSLCSGYIEGMLRGQPAIHYINSIKHPKFVARIAEDVWGVENPDDMPLTLGQYGVFTRVLRKLVGSGFYKGKVVRTPGTGSRVVFYPPGFSIPRGSNKITSSPDVAITDLVEHAAGDIKVIQEKSRKFTPKGNKKRFPTDLERKFKDLLELHEQLRKGMINLYEELLLKDQELARLSAMKIPTLTERERSALRRGGVVFGD